MLEPVALHQTGFRVPGLVQDARGLVVSTHAVVLLLGQERLVTLLRLLSEEPQLGDLLPSLRIEQVRNPLGAQSYLLRFACADSRLLDRIARAARLAGSTLCVGAGQHFVAYRDRRSQLGYDAAELLPVTAKGDYALYTEAFAQSFQRLRDVPLVTLLSVLPLLPLPGGARAALPPERAGERPGERPGERSGDRWIDRAAATSPADDVLWLACPDGLRPRLLGYLFHAGVLGPVLLPGELAGGAAEAGPLPTLLGLLGAPRSLLERLLGLPGVTLYRAITPRLLVELGYTHPLRLPALEPVIFHSPGHSSGPSSGPAAGPAHGRDEVLLFSGARRGFTVLPSPLRLPAERLVELRYTAPAPSTLSAPLLARAARPREAPAGVRVSLRLCRGPTPATPTATLLPWGRCQALSRLLYLLPLPALAGLRAACLDDGILILGAQGVPLVPLGELLYEAAPAVLAPLGWQLTPALLPSQIVSVVGGGPDRLVLLRTGEGGAASPLLIAQAALRPLSLSLLSEAVRAEASPLVQAKSEPPEVRNDPLPAFALWPLWGAREDEP
ncbi:MAG: hypothetical protein U1A78_05290 [Polyangia bacterium]